MGTYAFNSFQLDDVNPLIDGSLTVQGTDVLMKSGQTSSLTPNHRHPPGTVLVKESGDGLYYLAEAADGVSAGDINTVATVTSLEAADTDWDGTTITTQAFFPDGMSVTAPVVLGGADDSTSEVVTALNADAQFSKYFVASGLDAAPVVIVTRAKGAVRLKVTQTVITTGYGASGTEASGVVADVRVTAAFAELKDINAVAQNYAVPTYLVGKFDESRLTSLSDEARAILLSRGSRFE